MHSVGPVFGLLAALSFSFLWCFVGAIQLCICMHNPCMHLVIYGWYKLHSKTGKKEKERGELQLTVQFTRHNLTASMYDLSMKDKPRSAFIRLRERMRARKRGGDEESSSAIVPGGYGALARMRGRLPSDGGGEEDYEDDEGGEVRRSKMRSYFLHGRLRKSSDTRSSTSLGSESSESSSRGGSLSPTAGISVVVSDLSNSPSNSSNLTADNSPEHTVAPSPLVSPVRYVFDEECDLSIPVPHSLTTDSDAPILLPSVCVNGNPVETSPLTHQPPSLVLQHPRPQTETQQSPNTPQTSPPQKGKPTQAQTTQPPEIKPQPSSEFQTRQTKVESKSKPDLQFPAVGLLQKGSALSLSLQNLSRRKEEQQGGGPIDGRRWSFDKPGEEEKAAIAAALDNTGLMADEVVVEMAVSVSEIEVQGKKKRGLFSHARAEKVESGHAQPAAEGRHRGWFSSKDPYSKPSPTISQPEVPASSPRNTTSPLIVVEAGNSKGILVDGASPNLTNSFCRTDASDDSDKYTQCDAFMGNKLKLNSKIGTPKMTTLPSSYPIEPTNQTPTCGEAKSLPHTVLAAAALPPVFAACHDYFPQEEHQVAYHKSSPHPVKPLTPPDEKRSEGRSMLEKLKSTIHPGRGHQGDQEPEKKLLVEGGGSYYHLNHSELVSLLVQRDAELQQEREEYERRGLLLQKREVELKKMKILIRDLEDYIDTLLVRIMEQTPALLQVRSKIK
ncbi:hypothetical protein AMELA_G00049480 [Ameiurus melas]|uniref:FIP-RBD domain-containing protein n=1 Tax=Ameiurus melas TaxID=219545 RepID=A0A7J6B847_AMEME|nr:hypothetical protein AMELA_G00049480 [Ameiurus melas]